MYYSHTFNKRSSFETDLLFNQVESRTTYIPNYNDWLGLGIPTLPNSDDYSGENCMHLSYLNLPVYYGYTVKKFTLYVGFQTSLKLGTSCTIKSRYAGFNFSGETRKLINIDNLDYGPKIGLTWKLSTYLDIEGTWYYGLNNITHDPFLNNFREHLIRQLSVGIRYILTRKK